MAEPGRACGPRNLISDFPMQKHPNPTHTHTHTSTQAQAQAQARLCNGSNQLVIIEGTEVRQDNLILALSEQQEVLVCLCGGEGKRRG